MRSHLKWLAPIVVLIALALALSACGGNTDANVASHNLSKEAEQFHIPRRVIFYNGITDKVMETVEGYCSIEHERSQLEVTCKVQHEGKSEYFKEFLGLSDNVTYMAQQLEPAAVSTSHYLVIIKPSALIPDISIK